MDTLDQNEIYESALKKVKTYYDHLPLFLQRSWREKFKNAFPTRRWSELVNVERKGNPYKVNIVEMDFILENLFPKRMNLKSLVKKDCFSIHYKIEFYDRYQKRPEPSQEAVGVAEEN